MPDFDQETDDAVDVVARHFVLSAMERFADNAWEHYPDISQHIFDEIEQRAMKIVGEWPDKRMYQAAYDHLDHLAQEWAKAHPDEE